VFSNHKQNSFEVVSLKTEGRKRITKKIL